MKAHAVANRRARSATRLRGRANATPSRMSRTLLSTTKNVHPSSTSPLAPPNQLLARFAADEATVLGLMNTSLSGAPSSADST